MYFDSIHNSSADVGLCWFPGVRDVSVETATTLWFLESFIWHRCEFYEFAARGDCDNILVWAIYAVVYGQTAALEQNMA